MGYTKQALKGVSWVSALRFLTRGISFLRIAILARILTPSQFGAFGVASLILSFLEILTETGVNIFLIQHKEDIKKYIDPAWLVSIVRGLLISLLLIILAPLIVKFFNSPESYQIIILIAIVPFIRGFINPSIVNIHKNIEFHKEFLLRFTLFTIDAVVAIVTAFITKSAESFAYGLIAAAIVEVTLSFVFFKTWPRLGFDLKRIKEIISKGWWVTVTGIFSYFADNGDNIFVGRILGSSSLGMYQVAYKISTFTISELVEVVNKVTFPVYTKFSDEKDRLLKAFLKVNLFSSLLAIPLGLIIFIFAEQIVLIILGNQWLEVTSVVRILSIYGIIRTIFGNFSAMFLSVGKQSYVAVMTLFRSITLLILIVPLINLYQLNGAGYAMLISIFIEIPVLLFFAYKIFSKKSFQTI